MRFELERIPDAETFHFKPLIDDAMWSIGSNYVGAGEDVVDIWPTFEGQVSPSPSRRCGATGVARTAQQQSTRTNRTHEWQPTN